MSLFGDLTGGRVEFRVVLDRSLIEVYAAGQCLTRVIPYEPGDDGVSVFAEGDGEDARITSLSAWQVNAIW